MLVHKNHGCGTRISVSTVALMQNYSWSLLGRNVPLLINIFSDNLNVSTAQLYLVLPWKQECYEARNFRISIENR